ncbi:MAG TPA: ATP-binding protein [Steroidobacteraceae bacterium]|nr:ATP-binding protein [Steroidobacteraceae bacterium]
MSDLRSLGVRRAFERLRSAGLRGQVAGILLLGLVLSQVVAALLYMVLLPSWQLVLRPDLAVEKVSMTAQLLEAVPSGQRARLSALWNTSDFHVSYLPDVHELPAVSAGSAAADPALRHAIAARLGIPADRVRALAVSARPRPYAERIEVLLPGTGLLEVRTAVGLEHRLGLLEQIAIATFVLFAMGGLWIWLTWTLNAPLRRFAQAAERVGLDVHAPALPEQGPAQLRRVIRAFNEMQVRLQRYLSDRTRMLGTISHDLRTPLTRLRLRIETGRITEDRTRMLQDIESMEAMLSSALAFVRSAEEVESSDTVDLDLLLQTVCDLVSDLGGEVSYVPAPPSRFHCKPQALLRAVTNVVTNAVKYGARARIRLVHVPERGYEIEVEDDGPGIPDAEKDKVFEPFYRSAAASESDSEGMGLGLAIARSIVLAHGGTIELHDARPRGLLVRIFLPERRSASAELAPPAATRSPRARIPDCLC